MKKLILCVFLLLSSLSFSFPKWFNEKEMKAMGYTMLEELSSSFIIKKELTNGDFIWIRFWYDDGSRHVTDIFREEEKINVEFGDHNKLIFKNNDVMVAEYHGEGYVYGFYYLKHIDALREGGVGAFITARYLTENKISKKELEKLYSEIFSDISNLVQ